MMDFEMQYEEQTMEETVCVEEPKQEPSNDINADLEKKLPERQEMIDEEIKPVDLLRLDSGEPSGATRSKEQIDEAMAGPSEARRGRRKHKIADFDRIFREIMTRKSKTQAVNRIKVMSKTSKLYLPVEKLPKKASRKRRRPRQQPRGGVKKRTARNVRDSRRKRRKPTPRRQRAKSPSDLSMSSNSTSSSSASSSDST